MSLVRNAHGRWLKEAADREGALEFGRRWGGQWTGPVSLSAYLVFGDGEAGFFFFPFHWNLARLSSRTALDIWPLQTLDQPRLLMWGHPSQPHGPILHVATLSGTTFPMGLRSRKLE